jgi:sugar phosphate isomerase/epimerase
LHHVHEFERARDRIVPDTPEDERTGGPGWLWGVDLLVKDLVDCGDDPCALRERMHGMGLRAGAFPLSVHLRARSQEFQQDLAWLPRYAEAAAVMDVRRMGTWVMPETPQCPATPFQRDAHHTSLVNLHVERLGAIARVLAEHGIQLGLETIGVASARTGRGMPFVHRLADLDRVLGTLRKQEPNLGPLVDVFHLYAAGEPIEAGLCWGVERVVWVHVSDLPASASTDRAAMRERDRGLPGDYGAIATRPLLELLANAR